MLLLDQAGPAWAGAGGLSVTKGPAVGMQEHGGRSTALFRECSVVRASGRHGGETACRGPVTLHPCLGTASQKGPSWVSARAPQGWAVISEGSPGARQWAERD